MEFEAFEYPFHSAVRLLPVDHEPEAPWRVGKQKIVSDAEVRNQTDFLKGRPDAERLGGARSVPRDIDWLPKYGDRPCNGDDESAKNLDQSRFSRPILAEKSVNLAATHREADAVESLSRAKALADVLHLQSGGRSLCCKSIHQTFPG